MRIEAGRFRGRRLPAVHEARPAGARLRRSLFGALGPRTHDARVLDLFAGAGALGLEALSRGAREVVLAEADPAAVRALRRWLEAAGAGARARVLRRDLLRGPLPRGPFDLVFLDPPFALWGGPDAGPLLGRAAALLGPGGLLALKVPRRLEVPVTEGVLVVRRREVGEAAWVLLEGPSPGA